MTPVQVRRLATTLKSDYATIFSFVWLALLATIVAFPGLVPPADPFGQSLGDRLLPPFSWNADGSVLHVLGTDALGRDLLSRLVAGARFALGVSLLSVVLAGTLGTVLGLVSGYFGKWVDDVIMRLADLQIAFPGLLVALFVLLALGPVGIGGLILVITVIRWPLYARLVRATSLSIREREFVAGARLLGASDWRILYRHILPNLTSQVYVLATLEVARMMLLEASLSYLGMGIQPPGISWGMLVAAGQDFIRTAWWLVTFSGLVIFLTALSLNLVASWGNGVFAPSQRWRWE